MNRHVHRLRHIGSALFREIRTENITFMAGSVAYHAFVSLLPLLLLLLTVASVVGNQTVEQAIFAIADSFLSRGIGETIVNELERARQSPGVSMLGLLVLLWGTLRIFRGLDVAFSDIYETEAENSVIDQFVDGLFVLATFGLALVVGGGVMDSNVAQAAGPLGWVVSQTLAVAGLSVAFFPMYYVFPDADVDVVEVVPGTVFAAAGFATLEGLFGFYAGSQSAENAVAGVVVLLTWLYFGALVVLVGAAINAVLGNRSRDVDIDPLVGGVSTDGSRFTASRAEIVDSVERTEAAFSNQTEVTLVAGDEEVTIPAPTHVVADTDESLLFSEYKPVRLEIQWTPAVEE